VAADRSFSNPADVTTAVVAASRSDDVPLRSAAAFTLGVLGGDEAMERLVQLSGDDADDVRSNAALALARLGRVESYEALSDMLALPDVAPPAVASADAVAQSRRYKRALVVINALRGVAMLVDATNEPPPRQVLERVEQLTQDPLGDVRTSAAALLKKVERLATPAAKSPEKAQ
jgi:HEAT repeat protein